MTKPELLGAPQWLERPAGVLPLRASGFVILSPLVIVYFVIRLVDSGANLAQSCQAPGSVLGSDHMSNAGLTRIAP